MYRSIFFPVLQCAYSVSLQKCSSKSSKLVFILVNKTHPLSFKESHYKRQPRRLTTSFFSCFTPIKLLRKVFTMSSLTCSTHISNWYILPTLNQSSAANKCIYSLHFSYTGCFWLIKFSSCGCRKTFGL